MTTNYERIKNMTVEEMAELIEIVISCGVCPVSEKCLNDYTECMSKDECINNIKQWLQSESEKNDK